jgi:hypothetical protein
VAATEAASAARDVGAKTFSPREIKMMFNQKGRFGEYNPDIHVSSVDRLLQVKPNK